MRYKAYYQNIDQDLYPKPFKLITESNNFSDLQDKMKKKYPGIYSNGWSIFYDSKHKCIISIFSVPDADEHWYDPSPFSELAVEHYKKLYANLFDEWADLNNISKKHQSKFNRLRKDFPKCTSLKEVKNILREEGYEEIYPMLPKWIVNIG